MSINSLQHHRQKIGRQKERLLSLIQQISKNNRQNLEGIMDVKNSVILQSNQISVNQQKAQIGLYEILKQKSELQRQLKNNFEELRQLRQTKNNIMNKEIERYSQLQKFNNRANCEAKKNQIEAQIKSRILR